MLVILSHSFKGAEIIKLYIDLTQFIFGNLLPTKREKENESLCSTLIESINNKRNNNNYVTLKTLNKYLKNTVLTDS